MLNPLEQNKSPPSLYDELTALRNQLSSICERHAVEIRKTNEQVWRENLATGGGHFSTFHLDKQLEAVSGSLDEAIDTYEAANEVGKHSVEFIEDSDHWKQQYSYLQGVL